MQRDPMELFQHELRDMYDAEHRLLEALDKMSGRVRDAALASSFDEHRRVTFDHVARLDKVFDLIEAPARRQTCVGIAGIIEEFETLARRESPPPELLDLAAAQAGVKVESYEIASYESLVTMAGLMGQGDAAKTLEKTLSEESGARQTMREHVQRLASHAAARDVEGLLHAAASGLSRFGHRVASGAEVTSEIVRTAGRTVESAAGTVEKKARRPAPRRTTTTKKTAARKPAARKTTTARAKTRTTRASTRPKTARAKPATGTRRRTTAGRKTSATKSRTGRSR